VLHVAAVAQRKLSRLVATAHRDGAAIAHLSIPKGISASGLRLCAFSNNLGRHLRIAGNAWMNGNVLDDSLSLKFFSFSEKTCVCLCVCMYARVCVYVVFILTIFLVYVILIFRGYVHVRACAIARVCVWRGGRGAHAFVRVFVCEMLQSLLALRR
jgi:hypothetical protein